MSQLVTLQLPEEALNEYRRGAAAAGKQLEDFLLDRLRDAIPCVPSELSESQRNELLSMEHLDDQALCELARTDLPEDKLLEYDRLLTRQDGGTLSETSQETLRVLGDEARWLSLRKSHAYMLLKWRGHAVPSRDALRDTE